MADDDRLSYEDMESERDRLAAELYAAQMIAEDLRASRDELKARILDIDAHATPYGDIPDDPGWVGTYLLTAGALHRALGKIGHTAPKCQAEAELDQLISQLRELVLDLQASAHVADEGSDHRLAGSMRGCAKRLGTIIRQATQTGAEEADRHA